GNSTSIISLCSKSHGHTVEQGPPGMAGHLRKCDPASIYLELDSSVLVAFIGRQYFDIEQKHVGRRHPGLQSQSEGVRSAFLGRRLPRRPVIAAPVGEVHVLLVELYLNVTEIDFAVSLG